MKISSRALFKLGMTKVIDVERYVMSVSLMQNNIISKNVCDTRRQYSDSSYYLSNRKSVYFT